MCVGGLLLIGSAVSPMGGSGFIVYSLMLIGCVVWPVSGRCSRDVPPEV